MAIDALVKPFLRLPLFQGLRPLQLTEIVRRADRVIYRPGEVLIQEDQLGDAAIVIVSGEAVRLIEDVPGTAAEPIVEGSIVSELSMLVETVHSATVVARSRVKALRLTRAEMHAAMADDPRLAEHMSGKLAGRLQKMVDDIRGVDRMLAELAALDAAGGKASSSHVLPLH